MTSASIRVRRAVDRFSTTGDGVESWHCFSFGQHYDPDNTSHGALVALNDVTVRHGSGFSAHRHADVEIISWVISGVLHHEDSTGHRGDVAAGAVQRLSAGTGVVHTETAGGAVATAPVTRFVQMWITPDSPGGRPDYAQKHVEPAALGGGFVAVAGGRLGVRAAGAVSIRRSGAAFLVGRLDAGQTADLPPCDLMHLYVTSGSVRFAARHQLDAGDSARVAGAAGLSVTGLRAAEVLVIAMDASG